MTTQPANVKAKRDFDPKKFTQQLSTYLERFQAFGFSGTVLLAQGDDILLHGGYGKRFFEKGLPMEPGTTMSIGSIAKQFTSALILILVDKGRMRLTDTLGDYFKVVPQDKETITIEHLLRHTSGFSTDFLDDFTPYPTDQFVIDAMKLELSAPPGQKYQYSNLGYSLLAIIIERVTGEKYQVYLMRILNSLGISMTGWFGDPRWNDDNSAHYYLDGRNTGSIAEWKGSHNPDISYWGILGNGGVCTSADQLFQWMRSVFTYRLFSKDLLEQMLTPGFDDYGFGWRIVDSPLGQIVRHNGGNDLGVNALAMYFRDLEFTCIIMSNVVQNGFGMAFQLESALNRMLSGDYTELPRATFFNGSLQNLSSKIGGSLLFQQNHLNQVFAKPIGQSLISFLCGFTDSESKIFLKLSNRAEKMAGSIIERDWEQVFIHMRNKSVDPSRIQRFEGLIQEFEANYGKLNGSQISGTVKFPNYFALTHVLFEGENGSTGLPFIWSDEDHILGFRPVFTASILSISVAKGENNILFGYDAMQDILFELQSHANGGWTLKCGNQSIEMFLS